jgi:NACalpha-BTF3-like transcription factor
MHTLLQKLLEKRGVDVKELHGEEKATFDSWNATLVGETVTVQTIADFCKRQLGAIEEKWEDVNNTTLKNERLMYQHTMYSKILRLISSEKTEREKLERYLTDLIDMDSGPTL